MKLPHLFLGFAVILITSGAAVWGGVGHYVTGEIAEQHLTETTAAEVERVLDETTLAESTTWMDEVRGTEEYEHTADWHWVTIPPGKSYEDAEKNPNGDIVEALERKISALKEGGLDEEREWEMLKMVIHMVGDIHQPMHVGTGHDMGGNQVELHWMGNPTNLHRVWDSDMINSFDMDHEEWTEALNHVTDETVRDWQDATVRDWAHESARQRNQGYDLPESGHIGWEYRNRHFPLVEKRLLQAGVRLAGVLNDIYDPEA